MNSKHIQKQGAKSRRNFIFGTLAFAAALSSDDLLASSDDHKHHHHGPKKNNDLIDAAADCILKGQLCRDHCVELVKNGDTTISDCLDAVIDTISMCETLVQLAVSSSRHLNSFSKVCIQVCMDCEKECRVHKDKHKECKECMESCIDCIKELKKVIA